MIPIAHQKPFLFVADVRLDTRGNSQPALEVWADFPHDNPYVQGPTVPVMIMVEAMAQAVGVVAAQQAGEARPGVLAMLKHVRFVRDAARDAKVFVRVTPGRWFGRLRVFATEAHEDGAPPGGSLLVSAEIVVAQT